MKKIFVTGIVLLLCLFILPILIVDRPTGTALGNQPPVLPAVPTPANTSENTEMNKDAKTVVRVLTESGDVVEQSMKEYLWSVVAAEMPAAFELEALKAQAVTARTYAAWKVGAGETKHPQADVCTDINCCQAFLDKEQAVEKWGSSAEFYTDKIFTAISETDGQIMTYDGQPIQAVFFSSANGRTEDAVSVWGNSVPYLVGVETPEGEDVPNYRTEVVLTADEFRTTFLEEYPGADLNEDATKWFENKTMSASGRVATLDVGGITVKGTELRSLFGLRSTSFEVEATAENVIFRVTGYGHGVGMSQYGANALAKQGKPYREILTWYYTGVKIGENA